MVVRQKDLAEEVVHGSLEGGKERGKKGGKEKEKENELTVFYFILLTLPHSQQVYLHILLFHTPVVSRNTLISCVSQSG